MDKTQVTRMLVVVVVLIDICAMIGCHRSYYRRQADTVVQRLVTEKADNPLWDSSDGSIEIDPQSRMFNPFSADHPPIPPDDPASHQFMHEVDGKPGYPQWHANGDTDYVAAPEWYAYLPVNEKGQLVLNLDRAFQLALLHSPELQQQKETLYQSALNVSLERFGFDSQLFAGVSSFLGFRRGSSDLRTTTNGVRLERLGITGATFVVGLANTILFNFTGSDSQSATSLLDFSIIQPLLRGAGRDRIMESLTQSERTLLANLRQLDRYQRGFFLQVAIGRNPGAGPRTAGSFLQNPTGSSTNVGGFYGLLLQQQQVRNQELNVRQLEAVLELFREFFARERLDAVQLKLFESSVYSQQSSLVEQKVRYETAVDRFVISLGLPPDLNVIIQDDFLDRFNLISDEVNERLIGIGELREQTGTALNEIDDLLPVNSDPAIVAASGFKWSDELNRRINALGPFLDRALKTLDEIRQLDIKQLEEDFIRLDEIRPDRLAYLKKLEKAIESGDVVSDVDPALYKSDTVPLGSELQKTLYDQNNVSSAVSRINRLKKELEQVNAVVKDIGETQKGLDSAALSAFILANLQEKIPGLLSELNNILLEMSLLQAQARSNSIEIIDVDIDSQTAIRTARCFRRDWMNARASLVDIWRQIEFVADQLESQFDLVLDGSLSNDGNNPFRIDFNTGQVRGGFRFDTPIVRINERNQYRQTLISYQQSRRQFYQFEDEIKRNLREVVRNLNRDKVLFELNRRSVQVQIEQIELNRLALEEPVTPGATTSRLGTSTARNLTDAIIGLNTNQNRFLGTWVEYEILRRNLDFDMGTMQVDSTGAWIDPGVIDNSIGLRAAAAMGIELDCQFCDLSISEPVNESDRESDIGAQEILNSVIEPDGIPNQKVPVPEQGPQGVPNLNAPEPSPTDRDYFRAVPEKPAGIEGGEIEGTLQPAKKPGLSGPTGSLGPLESLDPREMLNRFESDSSPVPELALKQVSVQSDESPEVQVDRIPVAISGSAETAETLPQVGSSQVAPARFGPGTAAKTKQSTQALPAAISWEAEMQSFGSVFDRFRSRADAEKTAK